MMIKQFICTNCDCRKTVTIEGVKDAQPIIVTVQHGEGEDFNVRRGIMAESGTYVFCSNVCLAGWAVLRPLMSF